MDTGGEQDVFDAALAGGDIPELENAAPDTPDAAPAAEAAGQEALAAPAPAADTDRQHDRDRDGAAHVPSWRLREISEEKRRVERELAELREWKAKVEKEQKAAEAAQSPPDMFVDPDGFVRQSVEQAMDPVQQALQESRAQTRQVVEHFSRMSAEKEHGADTVEAAYRALDEAIRSGKLNRDAVLAGLGQSMDPYGEIVAWHRRHAFEQEIAGDPKGWMERQKEALLKDPEFLARAVAAARGQAAPVTTTQTVRPGNVTPLPSLNATPRAGDEGDEPDDPADVFNAALGGR